MLTFLMVMTGLMAGIYFAFSAVIMRSFSALPDLEGARAMNKINDVILKTVFMPMFFGTTLWFAGLIIWALIEWDGARSVFMLTSALIYLSGMFFVTAFGNVPLNNELKQSADDEVSLKRAWEKYQTSWVRLNHIRTISCIASCVLLMKAIV